RSDVAVVREVDEAGARTLGFLARQVRHQVVAVEVDLVGRVADLVALLELFLDVGLTGRGEDGRKPVQVADNFVRLRPGRDLAGKPDHAGDPVGTLPARVLL